MENRDSYERGQKAGRAAEIDPRDPELQAYLLEMVEDRDRLNRHAREGNQAAAKQAAYLSGYLSAFGLR